jgi:hypothetical protein
MRSSKPISGGFSVATAEVSQFQPVTLTISDPVVLADVVGALGAYGKGKTKAKKTIREAGLEEFYSGNARKTARTLAATLAEAAGFNSPEFGSGAAGSVDEAAIDAATEAA